jgi:hypothetical protein
LNALQGEQKGGGILKRVFKLARDAEIHRRVEGGGLQSSSRSVRRHSTTRFAVRPGRRLRGEARFLKVYSVSHAGSLEPQRAGRLFPPSSG